MTNVCVLNNCSPRAIARRSGDSLSSQPEKSVKTFGFKPPDDAAQAPGITGSMFSGSLMPMQNGCTGQRSRASRRAVRPQAAGAVVVRLRGEQPELEIDDRLRLRRRQRRTLRVAGGRIVRLGRRDRRESPGPLTVSRPSHMTVLRNPRLVEGSGRRNIEASDSGAPQ